MLLSRCNRRDFLRVAGSLGASLTFAPIIPGAPLPEDKAKGPGKSIIILWLGGGASHIDLWSVGRHVGHPNQGPFSPIKTTAKFIEISEAMPKVAEQFKHLSVIRTLNSVDGERARAGIRMQTGLSPDGMGPANPHIGSVVGRQLAQPFTPLPFVSVGGAATGMSSGFLGHLYAPFVVQNPGTAPENVRPPQMGDQNQTRARFQRRKDLLNLLESDFVEELAANRTKEQRRAMGDRAQAHADMVEHALDVSEHLWSGVFEFDAEDNKLLSAYGNSGFGRGCLLARKLTEVGVCAVQVHLGGWDMHGDIADGIRRAGSGVLDPAMATLVRDLAERNLLEHTLVVCLSEFGRMPRLNAGGGRGRAWTNGWDIVLGGAGIKPGVEYGRMAVGGMAIENKPVSVQELFATLYAALGIDVTNREFQTRHLGASAQGEVKPIKELLAKK
jgi:hypothetical protein